VNKPVSEDSLSESNHTLWRQLMALDSVREQQSAFTCATGLPLALIPANEPAVGAGAAEPAKGLFCVQGCMGGQSGELCGRLFRRAEQRAVSAHGPAHYRCPTGLIKILAPVFIGERHVGNLVAGPFSMEKLNEDRFRRLKQRLEATGRALQVERLRVSWRYSPVLSSERGRALATMVRLFAQYLSECGTRMVRQAGEQSSPLLEKVAAALHEDRDHALSVRELAQRVSLSPCHFCKVFKKQTGLTFTAYRLRLRVERAQELLRNPHLRVSEIAFAAGFDSIQYFNRAFRRLTGCSPTEYRVRHRRENGASIGFQNTSH